MTKQIGLLPTWCQKVNETTEVILEQEDTTWKIWTKVTKQELSPGKHHCFKFIVKQHTGPTKSAIFTIHTNSMVWSSNGLNGTTFSFSNFTKAMEYGISAWLNDDYQFVISAGVNISDAHRVKPVEEWVDKDYLMTIGDKRFAINDAISKQLRRFGGGVHRHEVELIGVEYDEFITLIENPEAIDNDLTADKCRRLRMMEKKYGIKHMSEKVDKMLKIDFWRDADIEVTLVVARVEMLSEPPPEMTISKKYRIPNIPDRFNIEALEKEFDIYFYIQEYNGTSYLSIGVIIECGFSRQEYWSWVISLNIKLQHRYNPQLNRSADITREYNNYQKSAGCPTFMLSSELGDYMLDDGSFIVTISISPTVITNDIQYPGIHDVSLHSDEQTFNVCKDLVQHYTALLHNKNTIDFGSTIWPNGFLVNLLDIIYHRSKYLTNHDIDQLLTLSDFIVCPYVHNYCDRYLAINYRSSLLSVDESQEYHRRWKLPLLREAENLVANTSGQYVPSGGGPTPVYLHELPIDAQAVIPLTISRLLDIILPLKVFKSKKERIRLCEQLNAPKGLVKLKLYRLALAALEGLPDHLRLNLKKAYEDTTWKGTLSIVEQMDDFEKMMDHDGIKELVETMKIERQLIKEASTELYQLLNGRRRSTRKSSIGQILDRSEEECRLGRRKAADMFLEMMRKEEGSGMEMDGEWKDELSIWAQYLDGAMILEF